MSPILQEPTGSFRIKFFRTDPTGAGGRTRRALTGVTTGVIALLGAALGTAAAFLASLAWAHSKINIHRQFCLLSRTLGSL